MSLCTLISILICILISSCASTPYLRTVHTDLPKNSASENPASVNSLNAVASAKKEVRANEPTSSKSKNHEFGPMTEKEIEKYAYELGLNPKIELTFAQKVMIDERKKRRVRERALDSEKERLQYSKVLPWIRSDSEALEFLEIPSLEGRQVWINQNRILARNNDPKEFSEIMEAQDIAMGMPGDYVKKSWGEPDQVEISGNSIYRNERWKYLRQVPTPQGFREEKRIVYFEGGRVVGWETE